MRTESIDALVIFINLTILHDDLLRGRIQRYDLLSEYQLDPLFLVPGFIVNREDFRLRTRKHIFRQHRTVIRQLRFFGNHKDRTGSVSFSDGGGRTERRGTRTENNITVFGVVAVCYVIDLYRHKVFRPYAAGRADSDRCVENGAADHTLHESCAFDGFERFFFLHKVTEAAEIVSVDQISFIGLESHSQTFHHFQTQLLQTFGEMRHRFAAPAVASESRRIFSVMHRRIHVDGQIPDRIERFLKDRRCPEEDSVRSGNFSENLIFRSGHHIVQLHFKIPGRSHAFGDLFR